MSLLVIGAGVGRTGTTSLKVALERLLGGPCYHMYEVFRHPAHVPIWHAAVRGEDPDWDALFRGFVATVDWPAAAFWRPLSEAYPDAIVLLSVRDGADAWFRSANPTIGEFLQRPPSEGSEEWYRMAHDLLRTRFTPVPFDEAAAKAAYEKHNAEVRARVPIERLLEWQVSDGWEPLCERLGVPVPDEPFPRLNTIDDYRAHVDRLPRRRSWLRRALGRVRG